MFELLSFIRLCLNVYALLIIASAVLSWLLAFGIVNYSNPHVRQIWSALGAITEPALVRIRRFLPSGGGLDFSPLVLLLIVYGIKDYLIPFLMRSLG